LNNKAIKKIKKIKNRPNKPLAIMVKNIRQAKKMVSINNKEELLLKSSIRPILLLEKHNKNLLNNVSELDTLGIMLPYTALHYLIFKYINQPLVFTSSNFKNFPLTYKNKQQFITNILTNKRKIVNPIDDSICKLIENNILIIRRARGYVPTTINIKKKPIFPTNNTRTYKPARNNKNRNLNILALGAEENNTICVYKQTQTYISEHIGDINQPKIFSKFVKVIDKWIKITNLKPNIILCDKHPNYNSTNYAWKLAKKYNIALKQIQHHKSHAYSVAVEHNLTDFIAITCDGTGFGEDSTIWGGEIFLYSKNQCKRIAHFEPQTLIGCQLAIKEPLRMLIAILNKFLNTNEIYQYVKHYYNPNTFKIINEQFKQNFNCVKTSSCARILDAASAMLKFCNQKDYKARPALLLESQAKKLNRTKNNKTILKFFKIRPKIIYQNNKYIILTTPLFKFLHQNINLNFDKNHLAYLVQQYIADSLIKTVNLIKHDYNLNVPVTFSGGVAYNKYITEKLLKNKILINRNCPPGDGGISFGQIASLIFE
jgi:hydrogenase maturation protein HypF